MKQFSFGKFRISHSASMAEIERQVAPILSGKTPIEEVPRRILWNKDFSRSLLVAAFRFGRHNSRRHIETFFFVEHEYRLAEQTGKTSFATTSKSILMSEMPLLIESLRSELKYREEYKSVRQEADSLHSSS